MNADRPPEDQTAQALVGLADAGELAGPLAHEVNNFLNVLLLQLTILDQTLPAGSHPELGEIRRQGKRLAEFVKHWQRSRKSEAAPAQKLDLNSLLKQIIAAIARSDQATVLEFVPAPDLPPVAGHPGEVHRLFRFLLGAATAAARHGGGRVTVETEAIPQKARVRVKDTGPAVSPEQLAQFFEPGFSRPGTDPLALPACRNIVRRMNGTVAVENSPTGGVTVIINLPCA